MAAKRGTLPFSPFEWMISLRYLRARRKEGFISVIAGFSFLGIMLGVATLIIVMAVMNGFRFELLNKILGLNGHMLVQPIGTPLTDYAQVAERLNKIKGITHAIPLVEGQALASSPNFSGGVLVRGMREEDIKKLPAIGPNIRAGTLEGFDGGQGVIIGRRLADSLVVRAGDNITLISPRGAVTPFGVTPRTKTYKVAAVFEIGMSEYDSAFVFMPLAEAQAYFNRNNDVSAIEVYTENADRIALYRELVNKNAGREIYIVDWRQRYSQFFTALQTERWVMFVILTLIVLVAALNIISGLIMLVKDKGHDIAILRTMGASKYSVMRIFLITGSAIGIVGTLVGFIVGVVFCYYIEEIRQFVSWVIGQEVFSAKIYYLSRLPARIDNTETAIVIGMALTLSFIATIYPAWRAARLDPVEALRYE